MNYNLFLDEHGILRSKDRVAKSELLSYDNINSVLLGKHHLTRLVILDSHARSHHLGVDATLNHVRVSGFWIIHGRKAVKDSIKDCIVCKRFNARPFSRAPTPELPADRVNFCKPFAHTGIDYTGHFFCRDRSGARVKVYILIFTCLNSRAVHLELVDTMTTVDFVLAFTRFCNRFGLPKVVYSDNASTFLSGFSLITNFLCSNIFVNKFIPFGIKHKTTPIESPWFGATWERLIKTMKSCIYKTLGRKTFSCTEFYTLLSDIQLTLNNRPLTYRDSSNSFSVVTPSNFLSPNTTSPTLLISEDFIDYGLESGEMREVLADSLELREASLNKFWNQWYTSYLLSLRPKHRDSFALHELRQKELSFLRLGSIVLIKHPVRPRMYWSLGRIIELIPGADERVRVVRVERPDGSSLTTSVLNLYPLELDTGEEDSPSVTLPSLPAPSPPNQNSSVDDALLPPTSGASSSFQTLNPSDNEGPSFSQRPKRRAAERLAQRMGEWIADDAL